MGAFDWTGEIRCAFEDETTALRGRVHEIIEIEDGLFARSTVPDVLEVAPRDRLMGGVAVRRDGDDLLVRPYVFRAVCCNGTIAAQAFEARHLRLTDRTAAALMDDVRAAMRECGSAEAFKGVRDLMAESRNLKATFEIDFIVHAATHGASGARLKDLLVRLHSAMARRAVGLGHVRQFAYMEEIGHAPEHLMRILERYAEDGDGSRFGLLNAVTAVARDTTDPRLKWDLEELGGALAYIPGPLSARPRRPRRAIAHA